MRLIFLIIFMIGGFLKAQDLELRIADSISKINSTTKTDSLSIEVSRNSSFDSIAMLEETPTFKVKTKEDLAKKESLLEASKKSKIVRYRKIIMDTLLIKNYKVFYEDGSTEFIDTTLNILKEYKFNYLRKDYFELLPMLNVGQGFNRMGYDFTEEKVNPQLGAIGRNYGYIEREDVQYYEVPTPLTELFFKTTFDQGQLLDALISVNTSPNFNLTIAHKGLRSLGNYVNSRTNATNLRLSTQYKNFNERYQLRTHIVTQKLSAQENGGIDSLSVYFFEKAVEELEYDGFLDRARLVTNLEAQNTIQGKRYYTSQSYKLIPSSKDSLKYNLTIGHDFVYETKNHVFSQNKSNDFLGENLIVTSDGKPVSNNIQDVHKLRAIENKFYSSYNTGIIGSFDFGLQFDKWTYFKENAQSDEINFNSTQELSVNQQTISAGWNKSISGYLLVLKVQKTLKNDFGNSVFNFQIEKKYKNELYINAEFQYRTESPNFNYYLFRSSYADYNWNNNDWLLQKTSALNAEIGHPKWGVLSVNLQGIDDYLFFKDITPTDQINKMFTISPTQSKNRIDYFKTRFFQHIKFWKFGLVNTVQFQKILSNEQDIGFTPLNVPEWITRTSFFLETFVFKKALFIQTGATFQYFSKYYADQYHPVLGEFVSQNHTQIGNFPRVDLFLNAKIQQTRIFLKYEHFNSDRTGYDYYSSPFVPYRDGVIRFGLVWNMFQ
jgi:hypothetical protein